MSRISMIAAMSRNRIIGRNNDLPWHLPDDFNYFKEKTKGHFVIMGRRNYESLPTKFRPLPDRINVIITRNPNYEAEGAVIMFSIDEAIELAMKNGDEEPFIIGGGEIYKLGLEIANRIYLTEIEADIEGDTQFPLFNLNEWKETHRKHHSVDKRHKYAFDFVIYDKK